MLIIETHLPDTSFTIWSILIHRYVDVILCIIPLPISRMPLDQIYHIQCLCESEYHKTMHLVLVLLRKSHLLEFEFTTFKNNL